jgi:hypothetical protein
MDSRLNVMTPVIATLSVLAMLASPVAVSADWQDIAADTAGNRYVFDRQSVVHEGPIVRATVRAEYAKPRTDKATGKSVYASLDRMVVDCAASSFALQARTLLADDGTEIPSVSTAEQQLKLRAAVPDSISSDIVHALCESSRTGR